MNTTLTNQKNHLEVVADLKAQIDLTDQLRIELGEKIDQATLDARQAGATREQLDAITGDMLFFVPLTGAEIMERANQ